MSDVLIVRSKTTKLSHPLLLVNKLSYIPLCVYVVPNQLYESHAVT